MFSEEIPLEPEAFVAQEATDSKLRWPPPALNMKKILDWTFYLLGLCLFAEFVHELIHYFNCGGEFISGLGYIKGRLIHGGLTWCAVENGGELLPTIVELLIINAGVYLKIK